MQQLIHFPLNLLASSEDVILAEALHRLTNLILLVPADADRTQVEYLSSQLESRAVSWITSRDLDPHGSIVSRFFRIGTATTSDPTCAITLLRPDTLRILRRCTAQAFLHWRKIDCAARHVAGACGAPWDLLFDDLVARRRRSLAMPPSPPPSPPAPRVTYTEVEHEMGQEGLDQWPSDDHASSLADSGVAADDEEVTPLRRRRQTIASRDHRARGHRMTCARASFVPAPHDPIVVASVMRLGLGLASAAVWDLARRGWRVFAFGTAVAAIFAAGVGLGLACTTGVAALRHLAEDALRTAT